MPYFLVNISFIMIIMMCGNEVESCVQELHWPAPNASSGITIPRRIKRHIQSGWSFVNIVDFARHIRPIKKRNNGGVDYYGGFRKEEGPVFF